VADPRQVEEAGEAEEDVAAAVERLVVAVGELLAEDVAALAQEQTKLTCLPGLPIRKRHLETTEALFKSNEYNTAAFTLLSSMF